MGNDDLLTDDAVADLLVNEARDCSLKYSTMGMEAYTSSSSSSSRFAPPPPSFPSLLTVTLTLNRRQTREQVQAQYALPTKHH